MKVSTLLAGFLVATGPCSLTVRSFAFATYGKNMRNIHGEITRSAFSALGCSRSAVDAVVLENKAQDWDLRKSLLPKGSYKPEHHFDRLKDESDAPAFERGIRYVVDRRSDALAALRNKRTDEALTAIGRATHALQDLFSHSSFVDLGERCEPTLDALAEMKRDIPVGLRLTGYDPSTGKSPKGDTYGHDEFNKDGAMVFGGEGPESKAKSSDGRTKHAVAVEWATKATRRFLEDLRSEAGEAWKTMEEFQGKR